MLVYLLLFVYDCFLLYKFNVVLVIVDNVNFAVYDW